ncbi:MAG: helix-hairpin-helix domain-containing protein [Acidobacteria bacterium]|uniref:Helix-hairpin-helix domain-containing protein n=1 Tax=Candidatus Sulfomarinibacter kjeldsenii TaxID=2885994 RepID=A0A8J6Y0F7_9BACT|nr:helix-hairpin-helix domain-containing protein [Candidatus Sulfomarinibacter kjeldsenii]MBD3856140.1 helix-hairpin-helix domain-containing protein [Candidatus Sulfomarinibacter kjeldsenii]MBD3870461.1 helix-hairpin-helix domain-containing protein [Candidatus Sulfomarinibacter kjeldsenii]
MRGGCHERRMIRPRTLSTNSLKKGLTMQHRRFLTLILVAFAVTAVAWTVESSQPSGVVNINTASSEELELLPRVGPALAGRIIEFREANGPFQTVDEILAVKGIGESSFEKLEPFIVTSGATTLADKVRMARSTGDENVAD